jgi:hypothetical protein
LAETGAVDLQGYGYHPNMDDTWMDSLEIDSGCCGETAVVAQIDLYASPHQSLPNLGDSSGDDDQADGGWGAQEDALEFESTEEKIFSMDDSFELGFENTGEADKLEHTRCRKPQVCPCFLTWHQASGTATSTMARCWRGWGL